MQPEVSAWCAIQDKWDPVHSGRKQTTSSDQYFNPVPMSISLTNTHITRTHNDRRFHELAAQAQFANTHHTSELDGQANALAFSYSNPALYHPQPLMFTSDPLAYLQDATANRSPNGLYDQSNMFLTRTSPTDPRHTSSTTSSNSTPPTPSKRQPPRKTRRKTSKQDASPLSVPRLRRTSTSNSAAAAPEGSARALYLAKNRQAASKCRNKQKMRQDELVEAAREGERRNKALNGEVDRLKEDVQALMEIAGVHAGCADQRLRVYVERKTESEKHGHVGGMGGVR